MKGIIREQNLLFGCHYINKRGLDVGQEDLLLKGAIADLEGFPDNGNCCEIIDGEL